MTEPYKARIVYIEDNPALIDLVTMVLKQEQYDVHGAYTVKEGIGLIQQIKPDLILLDLMLPDADGWEIQKYLQNTPEFHDTPIIVLTARNRPVDIAYGEHVLKVKRYLTKPFLPDMLRKVVAETLAEK